ncbi:hypothetical protein MMC29_005619 [Sticta canariensis]|nr:hypothetical protein [Sticta canariensis]
MSPAVIPKYTQTLKTATHATDENLGLLNPVVDGGAESCTTNGYSTGYPFIANPQVPWKGLRRGDLRDLQQGIAEGENFSP